MFETATASTRQALASDSLGIAIPQLVRDAQQMTESLVKEVIELGPVEQRPACRERCTACCFLHVVASPMEVLAIAQAAHDKLSTNQLSELRRKIDEHLSTTADLNAAERQRIRLACPLLEQERCSLYEHRPNSCRGWNSLDKSVCDADLANPDSHLETPLNLGQYIIAGRVVEGMSAACRSLHLEHHTLDFVRGLKIALDDPAAAKDWRAGADVFQSAVNARVFPSQTDAEDEQARTQLFDSLGKDFQP